MVNGRFGLTLFGGPFFHGSLHSTCNEHKKSANQQAPLFDGPQWNDAGVGGGGGRVGGATGLCA